MHPKSDPVEEAILRSGDNEREYRFEGEQLAWLIWGSIALVCLTVFLSFVVWQLKAQNDNATQVKLHTSETHNDVVIRK